MAQVFPARTRIDPGSGARNLGDPLREVVVGGPWGGYTVNGGFLIAGAVDDVVRQFGHRHYELMQYDDAVAPSLRLIRAAVVGDGLHLSTPQGVSLGDDDGENADPALKGRAQVANEVKEFCERSVRRLGEGAAERTLIEVSQGWCDGCAVAEVVTTDGTGVDRGKLVAERFVKKPNWAWMFNVDQFLKVKFIRAWTTEGWADIDPRHFVIFTNEPRDGDPRGTSDLRSIYMPFNLKHQTYPDYGEFLRKFASKQLIMTAGPDQRDTEVFDPVTGTMVVTTVAEQMAAAGRGFKNHGVLAMPAGGTAQVVGGDSSGAAFDSAFNRFDRAIFRNLLFGTRPMQEAEHGSKADTESGVDFFGIAVEKKRGPLLAAFKEGFLKPLVMLNYGADVAGWATPDPHFGIPNHIAPDLLNAMTNAYEKGVFDVTHRPWIWGKVGAPAPAKPKRVVQPGSAEAQTRGGGANTADPSKPKPAPNPKPDATPPGKDGAGAQTP